MGREKLLGAAVVATLVGSFVFAPPDARAANLTQLPGVTAAQSSTSNGGDASRAIDNNTSGSWGDGSVTHTDGGNTADPATWTASLPSVSRVKQVDIYNRTDCCGGRLRDITIDVLGPGSLTSTSGELNNDNTLGGGLNDFAVGPALLSYTFPAAGALGDTLRVSRAGTMVDAQADNNRALSMAEVVATGEVLTNIALGKTATQTTTLDAPYVAANATNGNAGDFTHTTSSDANPSLTIDLGAVSSIDSIRLHNRESCCGGRLRDIRVELLGADGSSVLYTSAILNPDNTLGGGIADYAAGPSDLWLDFYALTGDAASGQFVRISRTNVVTGNDNTAALSLGEVQVFAAVPEPSGLAAVAAGTVLVLRRRRRD
jgi:hypothetical protein